MSVPRSVPPVGSTPAPRVPSAVDTTLANGLRVVAVRRRGVPRFEVRLRVPLVRGTVGTAGIVRLLPETLLSGAAGRSSLDIARRLEELGADLQAGSDVETLYVSGSGLTATAEEFLALMADVVAAPSFPDDEVAIERERVAHELTITQSQPAAVAGAAACHRLYGRHPYGRGLVAPDAVRKLGRSGLRRAHGERVGASGAVLVLVGDLDARKAVREVERAFGAWDAGPPPTGVGTVGAFSPGPIVLVDRPGAVQTNIRVIGPAIGRADPGFAPLSTALTAFGGYFSSRLTSNIRERRGYTYSPGARIDHWRTASHVLVVADVATEVTAPALVEVNYELARMASAPLDDGELGAAQRYLVGNLAMAIQTQAGLASYLAVLLSQGLDLTYLRTQPKAIEKVSLASAHEAAGAFFGPGRLATVLVGDAARIQRDVEALAPVVVEEPAAG